NNSVSNSGYAGVFANAGNNVTITGNTIFNNLMSGIQINDDGPIPVTGLNIKNNIIVQKNLPVTDLYGSKHFTQLALTLVTDKNNISTWGIIDSNYYARPMDDSLIINIQPNGGTNTPGSYFIKTLPGWANSSSFDANSKKSPKSITDVNDLRFEFNATIYSKTIFLDASYMDIKGELYNGNITLEPFSSAILLKRGALSTLPLSWLGVQAQWVNSHEAKVSWKVSQQENVRSYTVQYSSDGRNFTDVCNVNATASTNYNCIVSRYNINKNYYRVMQTDIDGKTTFSKIILLQTPKKSALSVYPNPAKDVIYIAGLTDSSEVIIFDSASKITNHFITVSNTQGIDVSKLAKGIYFFKLLSVKDTKTIKFMKE
ncbi:MAG: T9SS type A sorting domain-containing protein, partial [Ferruginibacter sp.]